MLAALSEFLKRLQTASEYDLGGCFLKTFLKFRNEFRIIYTIYLAKLERGPES